MSPGRMMSSSFSRVVLPELDTILRSTITGLPVSRPASTARFKPSNPCSVKCACFPHDDVGILLHFRRRRGRIHVGDVVLVQPVVAHAAAPEYSGRPALVSATCR